MYEKLLEKLEKAAEKYADHLEVRIETGTPEEIDSAIRTVGYIVAAVERVDRLHRENGKGGEA